MIACQIALVVLNWCRLAFQETATILQDLTLASMTRRHGQRSASRAGCSCASAKAFRITSR